MSRLIPRLLFLLLLMPVCQAVAAPKTDVVVLKNGDKITGEVKTLERGRLEFSTDSMGTVYICLLYTSPSPRDA